MHPPPTESPYFSAFWQALSAAALLPDASAAARLLSALHNGSAWTTGSLRGLWAAALGGDAAQTALLLSHFDASFPGPAAQPLASAELTEMLAALASQAAGETWPAPALPVIAPLLPPVAVTRFPILVRLANNPPPSLILRAFQPSTLGVALPVPALSRLTVARIADLLTALQCEPSRRPVSLAASVQQAARQGGLLTRPSPRPATFPALLILCDSQSLSLRLQGQAQLLAAGLRRCGLHVQWLAFAQVPDPALLRAWSAPDSTTPVLVFGDSRACQGAKARRALQALARWPRLVWLEACDPLAWGRELAELARAGLAVESASDGLFAAVQALYAGPHPPSQARYLAWQRHGQARLPVRIERILGKALVWAQACAMLPPPLALGLAEALRQQLFPRLSAQRSLERLLSLPEVKADAHGLIFSPTLLAVLRSGFGRQNSKLQTEVLAFWREQIEAAAPSADDGFAYLEWRWYRARLLLEQQPDEALRELETLAADPRLGPGLRGDLARLCLPSEQGRAAYNRIPLRLKPETAQGIKILRQFAPDCGLVYAEIHPFRHKSLCLLDYLRNGWQGGTQLVATFSPDGRWILSGSAQNRATLWDTQSGEERNMLNGDWYQRQDENTGVFSLLRKPAHFTQPIVGFSPDGRQMVTALLDNTVRLWDTASAHLIYIFKNHALNLRAVLFAPDGGRVLGVAAEGDVWDISTGRALYVLKGHHRLITQAALSPDGDVLATAAADASLRLWHALSGEPLQRLEGHRDAVLGLDFSPDGRLLASASADKSIGIWDLEQRVLLRRCVGHRAAVNSVRFSPDGHWLVSAAADKTVRVWAVADGREHQVLRGHRAAVNTAQFAPDGQQILSAANDLRIQTYSLEAAPG